MKQNKPIIIGLTGTIGSGKSTCSNILKEKFNLPVIDADKIAYQVCEKDNKGLKRIVEEFGDEYLLPNGEYNRSKMSETVFNNPEALEKLNKLLHPIIKEEKERQLNQHKDKNIIIYDCPLLFEANEDSSVDHILLISADEELRAQRLKERNGYNDEELQRRTQAQLSEKEKLSKADSIIFNNGTEEQLEKTLAQFLRNLT